MRRILIGAAICAAVALSSCGRQAQTTAPVPTAGPTDVTAEWALPAFNNADPKTDRARIEACLAAATKAEADPRLCTGQVSKPCLNLDSNASTAAMVGCLSREGEVWTQLLAARRQATLDNAPKKFVAGFLQSEKAWAAATEANCGLFSLYHEGGTIAAPMGADCISESAAQRYFFLAAFAPEIVPLEP